jgi:hypothetical protein
VEEKMEKSETKNEESIVVNILKIRGCIAYTLIPISILIFIFSGMNCMTRYTKNLADSSDLKNENNKNPILIKVNYVNKNPEINSFEMEPKIGQELIKSIAEKNNIQNIRFLSQKASQEDNLEDYMKEYDLTLTIDIYFYPTIQNVTIFFLIPTSSTAKYTFNVYNKNGKHIHSASMSRENIYFLLLFPVALILYDEDADEKIIGEYFQFLSAKINQNP